MRYNDGEGTEKGDDVAGSSNLRDDRSTEPTDSTQEAVDGPQQRVDVLHLRRDFETLVDYVTGPVRADHDVYTFEL